MPVKVNATTILREGARLIKEEEKEMKRYINVDIFKNAYTKEMCVW